MKKTKQFKKENDLDGTVDKVPSKIHTQNIESIPKYICNLPDHP